MNVSYKLEFLNGEFGKIIFNKYNYEVAFSLHINSCDFQIYVALTCGETGCEYIGCLDIMLDEDIVEFLKAELNQISVTREQVYTHYLNDVEREVLRSFEEGIKTYLNSFSEVYYLYGQCSPEYLEICR